MDFEIRNDQGGEIQIVPNLPEPLRRLDKLPANCFTLITDSGKADFLHYRGSGFTVSFNNYLFHRPTVLRARSSLPLLELHISCGMPIMGTWEGIRFPNLLPHQFSFSYTPHVQTRAVFQPGKSYQTFDIHFEKYFLQELSADFPVLSEFMERVEKEEPGQLSRNLRYCSPEMLQAIRFIEKNGYSFRAQKHLIEYKVKEIVIAAVEINAELPAERDIKLSTSDIEALHGLRQFIELHNDEMPSLKQLSRKCGLNEDKMKRGFKKLFGTTLYDYHIRLKMEEAKQLLLDTDKPVYEIAYTVGYHHVSNFCIEFKKVVGCQPGYFRKFGTRR